MTEMGELSMKETINQLIEVVGAANVMVGDAISADFCRDELPNAAAFQPEAVVRVSNTEEVSAVLKICNATMLSVTVRGAGTGLVGGCVPIHGGIVLVTNAMNQVLAFDEANCTLTVQPGVLLQDVKAEAERRGLYYPPDPGEKTATIGGNASTNAGGPCAVKYGVTRDYIVGATIVLADGTIMTIGGKEKDNSGYSLLQLFLGSEGTLGVITELTVKLVKKPKAEVILLFPFADVETCIHAAVKIQRGGFQPAVLEYMDTDLIEFSGNVTGNPVFPIEMDGERVGATLMTMLEGEDDNELEAKMETIAEMAEELECLDILVMDTPTMKREAWAAHDAFHTAMESGAKSADELNMSVPTARMAEFLLYVKKLGVEKGVKVMAYAHVGDGGMHVHVVSDASREEFVPVMAEFAKAAYAKCAELDGKVSSEHGIGYAKKAYLKAAIGEGEYALLRRIKAAFDPNGILNPGKVVD